MTHDIVRINDLILTVSLEDGATWPTTSLQPIIATLSITHDLSNSADADDLSLSVNYSSVCAVVADTTSKQSFPSLESLSLCIFDSVFQHSVEIQQVQLRIKKQKPPLHCKSVGVLSVRKRTDIPIGRDQFLIDQLTCETIIGVNACERDEKQLVSFDVGLEALSPTKSKFDFRAFTRTLHDVVGSTSFLTLEALASFVAREALRISGNSVESVTVRAAKPHALVFAASAEVELRRSRSDYPAVCGSLPAPVVLEHTPSYMSRFEFTPPHIKTLSTAAIALGSNLGDRFASVELALRYLEKPEAAIASGLDLQSSAEVAIVDTSFLYETVPMYVTDQPRFINCACTIKTNLLPRVLLHFLKWIETTVGRVPSMRNGPRAVDLDIIFFESVIVDTRPEERRKDLDNLEGELVIPHPRMAEREFVLRPLNDIMSDFIHPIYKKAVCLLLRDLTDNQSADSWLMKKVIPFPRYPYTWPVTDPSTSLVPRPPPTAHYWICPSSSRFNDSTPQKTYVMATLNATPDSFSDGSVYNQLPAALSYSVSSAAAGADIIDIGGYSTRPGAAYVSPEQEINRVVPVIRTVRGLKGETPAEAKARDVLISVDTFRPEVARAAIMAGANCINDVYAFTGPGYPLNETSAQSMVSMRVVARELAVPVVLMHSRGDAGSNKDYSVYNYAIKDGRSPVIEGIQMELGDKVNSIVKGAGGIRRWLVIVDPGIGFSKTLEGNLDTLRYSSAISEEGPMRSAAHKNPLAGYPILIGPSRKSFLGVILSKVDSDGAYAGRGTEPKERGWATAAAVACAVQQAATVVRVHDVLEMGDVARVSSYLRQPPSNALKPTS